MNKQHLDNSRRKSLAQRSGNSRVSVHLCNDAASNIAGSAYDMYKDLGLPLGSGMVESACKWLIQQRFKGVGMRWSEEGFNHLLHLRLAWVNGRFEALFGLALSPNP